MHQEIREPTPADLPALLSLMQPFNEHEGIAWDRARTEQAVGPLLGASALGFVLVADRGDRLLGYVVVTFNYDLEWGGRDAFVTELWVEHELRHAGIGRALLRAAEDRARAQGVLALHLVVRPENEAARRLYAREGFEPVPRVMLTKVLD
jgi:ribosomal protein S18 acetylase RimI-like enzyme